MKIDLIADSACDLTPAMRNLLGVQLIPFKLTVGEQHFVDDDSLGIRELLGAMKAYKGPASTACPSPDDYASAMRACETCFVVTISSRLSGSYNAAMVARDMVLEEHPEKRIRVLDSESASAGQTLLALQLHEDIVAGKSFEEIEAHADAAIAAMRTRFVLEDLSNLVKNGRISKAAGVVGSMLNLRPIMADDGHGAIACMEKVRGTQNAMRRLAELIAEDTKRDAPGSLTMALAYCNCADRADALRRDLLAKCPALREVLFVPTAGLASVYANDGGIVLAY